jgi:hypothetical protein
VSAPTWTTQLAEAQAERDAARARYDACPTWNKTKREAGEDLEFWMGKVAFLAAAVASEG